MLELGEAHAGATEGRGGESIGGSWYRLWKSLSQEKPAGGSNMVALALSAVRLLLPQVAVCDVECAGSSGRCALDRMEVLMLPMSLERYGDSNAPCLGIRMMGRRVGCEMRQGVEAGICDESMTLWKEAGGKRINASSRSWALRHPKIDANSQDLCIRQAPPGTASQACSLKGTLDWLNR